MIKLTSYFFKTFDIGTAFMLTVASLFVLIVLAYMVSYIIHSQEFHSWMSRKLHTWADKTEQWSDNVQAYCESRSDPMPANLYAWADPELWNESKVSTDERRM